MNSMTLSLLGGIIIGLASILLLLFHGKILGISGIVANVLSPYTVKGDRSWRISFIIGMLGGGMLLSLFFPQSLQSSFSAPILTLIIAGIFVGFGTRFGNGCTSGHGVCGIGRFSLRSAVATVLFIVSGIITVLITKN